MCTSTQTILSFDLVNLFRTLFGGGVGFAIYYCFIATFMLPLPLMSFSIRPHTTHTHRQKREYPNSDKCMDKKLNHLKTKLTAEKQHLSHGNLLQFAGLWVWLPFNMDTYCLTPRKVKNKNSRKTKTKIRFWCFNLNQYQTNQWHKLSQNYSRYFV